MSMFKFLRGLVTGRKSSDFHGGIDPEQHKITANQPIQDCPLSPLYILPMKQHIGQICQPLVEVGSDVLYGEKVAKSQGYLSAPIHSPVSGRVVKIEQHPVPHPSGLGLPSIFIEPDGTGREDKSLEPLVNYRDQDPSLIRERVRMAGIVGLGGAVFPSFIKLVQDKVHVIDRVILNGIECEPYLTNDHRLLLEHAREVVEGLDIIMYMVGAKHATIAIEDNKADAAVVIEEAVAKHAVEGCDIEVKILPTRYPQGSEKQLIQVLTGREVPAGKLPMHVGVICHNIGTTKAIYDAVKLGRPLTDRVVTLSGNAMPQPANMRVKLGTPLRFLLEQRGVSNFEGLSILHGGPMMGEVLPDIHVPVIKSSTGLLVMQKSSLSSVQPDVLPCIRCGHCGDACPANLVPNLLASYCVSDQFDKAQDYALFDCIECGCCSYVCPSNIPLVQQFRYAKGQVAMIEREHSFSELSRTRTESRDARLEKEKAEKAARRSRKRKPEADPVAKTEDQ
ncbi:MAG: electron transport complex subunit RsxC [Mariprofundaceae bacterium]